jgi:hypothetical protein
LSSSTEYCHTNKYNIITRRSPGLSPAECNPFVSPPCYKLVMSSMLRVKCEFRSRGDMPPLQLM